MAGIQMVHMATNKPVTSVTPVLRVQYILDDATSWSGSGTTITDKSGNGNNGTLQNSPTLASTTITSKGGPSPSYISTTYNLASTWTIHVVANISATNSYWCTLWGNDSWIAGGGWICYSAGANAASLSRGGGAGASLSIGSSYTFGTKRLMTFTYDGSYFKYYANGALVGTSTPANSTYTLATNNTYFGARHTNSGTGATDGMNATFYRMEIWSGAQSASDITAFYNSIKTQYGI